MKTYLIWINGRENPVEIPADTVSWKDNVTYRFNQYLRDDNGNVRKHATGEPETRTVGVFSMSVVAGFSWADQTAQY